MQPVNGTYEIDWTLGTWGFSILQNMLSGEIRRRTFYFVRDNDGMVRHAEIVDIPEVR